MFFHIAFCFLVNFFINFILFLRQKKLCQRTLKADKTCLLKLQKNLHRLMRQGLLQLKFVRRRVSFPV